MTDPLLAANDKLARENRRLRSFLTSLFDGLVVAVCWVWAFLYIGSVVGAWLLLSNKPLAWAIALSLTLAHAMMGFHGWLRDKRKELTE